MDESISSRSPLLLGQDHTLKAESHVRRGRLADAVRHYEHAAQHYRAGVSLATDPSTRQSLRLLEETSLQSALRIKRHMQSSTYAQSQSQTHTRTHANANANANANAHVNANTYAQGQASSSVFALGSVSTSSASASSSSSPVSSPSMSTQALREGRLHMGEPTSLKVQRLTSFATLMDDSIMESGLSDPEYISDEEDLSNLNSEISILLMENDVGVASSKANSRQELVSDQMLQTSNPAIQSMVLRHPNFDQQPAYLKAVDIRGDLVKEESRTGFVRTLNQLLDLLPKISFSHSRVPVDESSTFQSQESLSFSTNDEVDPTNKPLDVDISFPESAPSKSNDIPATRASEDSQKPSSTNANLLKKYALDPLKTQTSSLLGRTTSLFGWPSTATPKENADAEINFDDPDDSYFVVPLPAEKREPKQKAARPLVDDFADQEILAFAEKVCAGRFDSRNPATMTKAVNVLAGEVVRLASSREKISKELQNLKSTKEENKALKQSIFTFRSEFEKKADAIEKEMISTDRHVHEVEDYQQRIRQLEALLAQSNKEKSELEASLTKYKQRWNSLKESAKKKKMGSNQGDAANELIGHEMTESENGQPELRSRSQSQSDSSPHPQPVVQPDEEHIYLSTANASEVPNADNPITTEDTHQTDGALSNDSDCTASITRTSDDNESPAMYASALAGSDEQVRSGTTTEPPTAASIESTEPLAESMFLTATPPSRIDDILAGIHDSSASPERRDISGSAYYSHLGSRSTQDFPGSMISRQGDESYYLDADDRWSQAIMRTCLSRDSTGLAPEIGDIFRDS